MMVRVLKYLLVFSVLCISSGCNRDYACKYSGNWIFESQLYSKSFDNTKENFEWTLDTILIYEGQISCDNVYTYYSYENHNIDFHITDKYAFYGVLDAEDERNIYLAPNHGYEPWISYYGGSWVGKFENRRLVNLSMIQRTGFDSLGHPKYDTLYRIVGRRKL